MPSLSDVGEQFAAVLKKTFPGRALVQGKRGEGAEPSRSFVMWYGDTGSTIGRPKSHYESDMQVTTQLTRLEFMASFDGGDAFGDALKFALCFGQSQRFTDLFTVAGVVGVQGPTDLSSPEFAKFKTRADLRVILSTVSTLTQTPEYVQISCVDVVEESHSYEQHFCLDKEDNPHECG